MDDMVNIKEDISKLRSAYLLIQGILQEAEENQIDDVDIQKWLSDLVDIGYEARDVVEDFTTYCSVVKAERSPKSPHPIPKDDIGGSSSDQLAKNIKHVRERFDEKMKQSETFATSKSVIGGSSKSVPVYRRPKTGPFFNKQRDLFVGRRDVKEGIMKKLLDYSDNHVHVVPIWGMGGIGKTTIAQSIYNDKRVKEEDYPSKNRKWLCVGEKKFNTKEIIAKIIEEPCPDVDRIKEKLVEKFKGDKFLIVFDDVWELNNTEWNLLWDLLTNVGKGGVIIITTRIREIITATNTKVSNDLEPLSYEDCWKIFKRYAFADQNTNDNSDERLIIGRDIVKKLRGLPLAAKVVGRSLLNEPDARTWRNFLEAQEWKLRDGEDYIMPTLRWSYNYLPPHLKQCFTYCALFPKDHVFYEKELVQMWMAHDLIQNVRGGEQTRPEDVGAEYFKELVNASLLQCVDGKYVMHDMIYDLALLVSNEEFVTANALLSTDKMEKARHITIIHYDDDYLKNLNLCKNKRLLTLYIKNYCMVEDTTCSYKDILRDVFNHLKSIRVLVLVSFKTIDIPDCISELRHLRYLDISRTSVTSLPDSLCNLHNLQMLATPHDAILPKKIVNITSLRYVRANLPTYKGVGKLTSLQEVSSISVSEDGNIRELGDLRELHGKLTIEGLENVTSSQDAASVLMQDKIHIDQLTLVFKRDLGNTAVVTEVLDALRCPPNLTYLNIRGYNGLTLPPLGELSYLKHLTLKYMNGVERFGDELYGKGIDGKVFFPSLESLYLGYMKKWKEWDGILIEDTSASFFPRLTKLDIRGCSELVSVLPTYNLKDKHPITTAANFMRSLSTLSIYYCDGLVLLQLDALVSLKCLKINGCSKLTRIPSVKHFATTIEELSIEKCNELIEMEFESLPSLKKLEIHNCNKLISVPRLVKIEDLKVDCCEHLSLLRFNLQGINSVKHLVINECAILKPIVEEGSNASSSSSSSSTSVSLPPKFGLMEFNREVEEGSSIASEGSLQGRDGVFFSSLESLRLTFMKIWKGWDGILIKDTSLPFFPCLKKLEIYSCPEIVSILPTYNLKEKHPITTAANFMRSLSTLHMWRCDGLVLLQLDALVSLKKLYIFACYNLTRISAKDFAITIEEISISGCDKLMVMEFESLPSLKKLEIHNCNKLISVPRLVKIEDLKVDCCEHLSLLRFNLQGINSLKHLVINECPILKPIVEEGSTASSSASSTSVSLPPKFGLMEFNREVEEGSSIASEGFLEGIDGKVFFSSLESLRLRRMKIWKGWDRILTKDTSLSFFPCLKKLEISYCPEIVSILPTYNLKEKLPITTAANFMRSLSTLSIYYCDGLVLLQLDALVSLKQLKIVACYNLTRISAKHFAITIEEISIRDCDKLKEMDFESLPSLKKLEIHNCNKLISVPRLVKIEDLKVDCCERLSLLRFNLQGINSVKHLVINECPILKPIVEEGSTASSSSSSSSTSVSLLPKFGLMEFNREVEEGSSIASVGSLEEIDGKVFFPCLESLYLECRKKWKVWDGILIEDTSASFFPRLTKLDIHGCSELVSALPTYNLKDKHPITSAANFMRSLSTLSIYYCDGLVLLQLDALVSLRKLEIVTCCNLTRISAKYFAITIEEISIRECHKLKEMDFESLPSLKKLEIHNCNKLISVPRLVKIEDLKVDYCGHLSLLRFNLQGINSVRHLAIIECPILKPIVEEGSTAFSSSSSTSVSLPPKFGLMEFNREVEEGSLEGIDGKVLFPSLESLYLECRKKWKVWDGILIEDTSASFFPRLTKLDIRGCSELVSVLPTYFLKDKHPITTAANFMRSLSTLSIYYCDGLVLLQLDALVSLKKLEIVVCSKLTRIPSAKHFATTIEELLIAKCNELIEMEFESLPSLKKLIIHDCNKLISVPRLVKIEGLKVGCCEHLSLLRFNLQGINSLKDLSIRKCPLLKLMVEEGSAAFSSTTVSLPSEFEDYMNILTKYRFEEDAQGRMALIRRS